MVYSLLEGQLNHGTPFFEYHTRPTWPMSETMQKWTLILHRPWIISPKEVLGQHALYIPALNEYFHMEE